MSYLTIGGPGQKVELQATTNQKNLGKVRGDASLYDFGKAAVGGGVK